MAHLREPLRDESISPAILSFASQGSLQALAMTCAYWLDGAYQLAPERWGEIDMKKWPFAVKEVQRARQQASQSPISRQLWGLAGDSDDDNFFIDVVEIRPRVPRRPIAEFADAELWSAVRRLAPNTLRSLVACSLKMTAAGLARVLRRDASRSLVRLCLGSGTGGIKATPELQEGLDRCVSLRELELHRTSVHPPTTEHLVDLRLDSFDWLTVLPAVARCHKLRILALDDNRSHSDFPVVLLLRVFGKCTELCEINIYCTPIRACNAMLACLVEFNQQLECFSACRAFRGPDIGRILAFLQAGPGTPQPSFTEDELPPDVFILGRRVSGGALTDDAIDAFHSRFPSAHIFIDDVEREQLEEDFDDDF